MYLIIFLYNLVYVTYSEYSENNDNVNEYFFIVTLIVLHISRIIKVKKPIESKKCIVFCKYNY